MRVGLRRARPVNGAWAEALINLLARQTRNDAIIENMTKKLQLLVILVLASLLPACSGVLASFPLSPRELGQALESVPKTAPADISPSPSLVLPNQASSNMTSPTLVPPVPVGTPTASPTSLPTPTPTPTPLHPLTIEWLRQMVYPGSGVVIEQVLDPGANYNRYIASYRSQGLKIYALLTVPMEEKPASGWPVIVFNHGYIPPAQYRTTERYVDYVDAFARRGYIVFRSDYRGHGNSQGVARGGYGNPDYTIDVLNAVASMKRYPDADPDRIGMWGHSMGGYITLRSMVVSEDIKAGVIWAGVVASYPDLLTRWRLRRSTATPAVSAQARRWRDVLVDLYGSPEDNPAFWSSISANAFLEDLSGPLQLHHGTADQSVPVEFSKTLYQQVQAAGGIVEYYSYEDDNHNISIHFSDAMYRSILFFDTYVKGNSP